MATTELATTELAMLITFPALMAFAGASDLLTMTISNWVSGLLVLLFAGLAVGLGLPWETLAWHIATGFAVLAVTFAMFAAGWIGGGDAKLAAATAVWVGPLGLVDYLILASLFGGGLTLAIVWWRSEPLPLFAASWQWASRLHHAGAGIPYGIALAAAGLIVYPATPLWQAAFGA
jgi:prepilin peptidase CpaA